ncbi:Serine/threonine-protein kinase PrkC [Rubripirellula tenax]|uniref:non-specific serine/threonine protein kinase n=1 Tax=Rubripirellula tenax TaxID=2528015 RepID=A0A5C6F8S8_9BACT|nr:serine/threonine-protein kinase [Rubripirellula tenax]TWU56526.1 Serine/threonine-protein kinase PrkC [Rubripirellula tenax]
MTEPTKRTSASADIGHTTRPDADAESHDGRALGVTLSVRSTVQAGDLDDTVDTLDESAGPRVLPVRTASKVLADFGDYELLDEIARGGMGVVFRAKQKSANRVVALKRILAGRFASDEEVQRFYAEAESAARLDHPNIVPVFDVGVESGHHYFSMGFVDGQSLNANIHQGPTPVRRAAQLVETIASAVGYAHDQGVIHRDLKPANVLLSRDGVPRVTDFGLAKQVGSSRDLTATGQIMGTPSYMPPEQASGQTATVGPAADIYALGAILYALLTGRPPFQAASAIETIRQVLEEEPLSPSTLNADVDRDLETICLKCLQKDSVQRYATAGELGDELSRYLSGEPIHARPVSRVERTWRWCKRNRLVAGLMAGIGFSLVIGICLSTYFAMLANARARRAQEGTQIAVATLETMINTLQTGLARIPAARELRQQLLRDSLSDLQRVSGEVKSQARVDLSTAKVLTSLGLIFSEFGDDEGKSMSAEARDHLQRSVAIYQQLRNQNDKPSLKRLHANALNQLGNLFINDNQIDSAETSLTQSIDLFQSLLADDPDNETIAYESTYPINNLGDIDAIRGNFEAALVHFETAVAMHRRLRSDTGENLRRLEGLADSLMRAGDACHDLKRNDGALRYFAESKDLSRRWYEAEPKSSFAMDSLSFAHERLGNHWLQVGDANNAKIHYEGMLALTEKALVEDPKSRFLLDGLSVCYQKLANTYARLDETEKASEASRKAAEARQRMPR